MELWLAGKSLSNFSFVAILVHKLQHLKAAIHLEQRFVALLRTFAGNVQVILDFCCNLCTLYIQSLFIQGKSAK